MARYVFDEIKKEFHDEGCELPSLLLIRSMVNAVHQMGYSAPGEVPEEKYDELKNNIKEHITKIVISDINFCKRILALKRAIKNNKRKRS